MGNSKSSRSSSSNSSSRNNSNRFSSSYSCNCDKSYWYSKCIETKSYHLPGDAGLTAGRAIAGIFTLGLSEAGYGIYKGATNAGDGINHYFVEILYKCSNCGKNFYKVYQWWDGNEIVSDFEYCSNYDNNRRKSGRNLSYNTIESLFDSYKRRSYNNCQFFANNFYDAIVNY